MKKQHRISAITRRDIPDYLCLGDMHWAGRLDEPDFCVRVWPNLNEMSSNDRRFCTAYDDIYQHAVFNYDWDKTWIFTDGSFDLMGGPDETFLEFLCQTVHPLVRDPEQAAEMVKELNRLLRPDGYMITPTSHMSGRAIYESVRVTSSHHPTPPSSLRHAPCSTTIASSETTSTASSGTSVPIRLVPLLRARTS